MYFYDAPPYQGRVTNPLDGAITNFADTARTVQNEKLLQDLELQPNFAVRRGVVSFQGWKLGDAALRSITATPRPILANDLVPDLKQKGVDMRIGLDIAWLATKRIVDAVVLVTGDSDFVPAMKLARKEGLRIYLETLEHPVYVQLKVHADMLL
ncbi:MAG: NYN domain-containing protein [Acidobacteriia bacterium]|nr:NYN domain-containing protein [Terriglobia bacterium]